MCETKPNLGGLGYLGNGRSWYVGRLRRKVECAKRTQFPVSRAAGNTGLCKTNPISRGDGWDGTSGTRGERAKQTQFRPSAEAPGGQNAQNEPNFGERTGRSRGAGCANKPNCRRCADREICVPGSQACQTKPISQLRIADFGSRIGGILPAGRPIVQNEPNLGQLGQRAGGEVYKRSQFGGPIVQDEANPEGEMCKTNPICPRTGRRGCGWSQSCKTNPIPRRLAAGGNTQQSTIPSFHHSSPTRPSASSEDCACRCHPALPPMVGAFVEGLEGILAGCGPGGR
jgi:hypothetical protein